MAPAGIAAETPIRANEAPARRGRNRGRQAGVVCAKLNLRARVYSREIPWTFPSVADAKGVGNCLLSGGVMCVTHPPGTLTTLSIWHFVLPDARTWGEKRPGENGNDVSG